MEEADVFPEEAADVAMQAIKDGVARLEKTREQVLEEARADIMESRALVDKLMEEGYIKEPPPELIEEAIKLAVDALR